MSGPSSALLLATVGDPHTLAPGSALSPSHHLKLKAALELPGAAIAITGHSEYLGIYPSPGIALQAALAFQVAAEELLALAGRVVLDLWPSSMETMPVELARAILKQAEAESVLITPAFAGVMPASQRARLAHGAAGRAGVLRGVTRLLWQDAPDSVRVSTRQLAGLPDAHRYQAVRLVRRGRETLVRAEDCPFSIGRDTACALHLNGPNVSRLHGAIQHEGKQFYFRDDSRNGSYLTTGGEEIYLHGERFPLVAKGVISPGATLVQQTGDVIRYHCLMDAPAAPKTSKH